MRWDYDNIYAGGFGSNAGGGGFGSKPAFGSSTTTSGGFLGSPSTNNAATTGFGGFGSTNNNTSSPFGGGNAAGGGMFGSNTNKPGFGAASSTGSSLFGGGATNSGGGFGSEGFGAANNPGLGGVGDPPGTASTPFQALTEKEPNSTNQSNSFQNILFQDPYKKWSAEELRLADYVQGRRHGNASGAGAFGVSSGFGGGFASTNNQSTNAFGGAPNTAATTTGGLFGSGNTNNSATAGFGQTGANAFGGNANNTSGGLFGSNKPGDGMFGNTSNQQSGGLFGSGSGGGLGATNNAGAFGATSNTAAAGGLFGANNQANKPQGTGFSFGNTKANATSGFGTAAGGGFGATNNSTGGSGLFGNTNTNQQSGGGLFGNVQQPQQNTSIGFGAGFGTQNTGQQGAGLFGNNQQKPASGGLFGSSNSNQTSGGVFGNANAQQPGTGAFGASNTTPAAGGLFGAAKPSTGTGLFGATNQGQNATGSSGLFGGLGANTQNQQPTGSLFGAVNNAQQKPGGLFGSSNQPSAPGSFGGQSTQNQGSSLFGNPSTKPQTQAAGFGGSLLGGTQQIGNTPQGLTANLNDVSAYGSPSLFAGVTGNEVSNPGPLATPLSGNAKPRRGSILPMYKLAPAAASRFSTPQKRGFGFSYSSYGTPGGSPASSISSTPGVLSCSLLGPNSSGTLSKSMSTNDLRRSFNTEDSILAPGAFSSSSSGRWYGSTGSKKLVINRDIRSDLFSTTQKDKHAIDIGSGARKLYKRVSFDTSNVGANDGSPVRNALPSTEGTPSSQNDESTPRQSRSSGLANGMKTPDAEQVKGNELAIVHEEDSAGTPEARSAPLQDNAPGDYWMVPSKEELLNMNRMQRQRIDGFTIGRDNVGSIKFKIPVDISGIEIDELSGDVIQLEPRSATVYPNPAKKPPVGKGLNVPARISLEHSWPRAGLDKQAVNDPKRFKKHVERLRRIPDTTFEDYNQETGVWTFSVEHFTTYGLDDSDSDDGTPMGNHATDGPSSTPPQPPTLAMAIDPPMGNEIEEVKQTKGVPGAFDHQEDLYDQEFGTGNQSFLGTRSADPASHNVQLSLEDEHDGAVDGGYDLSEDEDMTRSSIGQHHAAERDDTSSENDQEAKRGTPGGILRARMRAIKDSVGPVQLEVADGDDWMEMLRKTVSPVKRDRQLLREWNESPSKLVGEAGKYDDGGDMFRKSSVWGQSPTRTDKTSGKATSSQMAMDKGHGFATSIDLMNSLFEKPRLARDNLGASQPAKGFPKVWPPRTRCGLRHLNTQFRH